MTLKVSTGLRNQLLDGGSLKAALAGGLIKIYTGPVPASADDAVTGTLLTTVSLAGSGTGIDLGVAAGGTIPKDPSQSWSGINVATGTAVYFRHVAAGDDGTLTATSKRLQGTCGTAGADLNMSSVNLVANAPQVIDAANFTMPASA